MKTLSIGCFIFFIFWQQGFADETTLPKRIVLTLDDDSTVLVKGFIAPIEYSNYNFHVEWGTLANLRVAAAEKRHPASVFQAFLPSKERLERPFLQELKRLLYEKPTEKESRVSVGDIWQIEQNGLLALLKQLHPDPHLDMHIDAGDSRGAWACLRGYNAEFADIVFRVHAEFKLEGGWFIPSQFTGHLVIARGKKKVAFFRLYVPPGVRNFDVIRYHNGGPSHGTDAGFCPKIELLAGAEAIVQDTQFSESITLAEAERALILRFYKSQQIHWVPVDEALEIARTEQKLIHVISTNGPLTDEAC